MKQMYCEVCEAPLPAHRGRGQPRRYCSPACKQVAHRRRREKQCEYCDKVMDGKGRFCSARCYYHGHGGIVPFEKQTLAAFDEGLIQVHPRGYVPPGKPWHSWVYGGAERPRRA